MGHHARVKCMNLGSNRPGDNLGLEAFSKGFNPSVLNFSHFLYKEYYKDHY